MKGPEGGEGGEGRGREVVIHCEEGGTASWGFAWLAPQRVPAPHPATFVKWNKY